MSDPMTSALTDVARMRALIGKVQRDLIEGAHRANTAPRGGWQILRQAVLQATLDLGETSDLHVLPGSTPSKMADFS